MAKRPFAMNYKTYDDSRGHGEPREWRAAFNATMGLDEAKRTMGDLSPWAVLGIERGATLEAITSAFRRLLPDVHPDRCAIHGLSLDEATERTKRLIAAFTLLKSA